MLRSLMIKLAMLLSSFGLVLWLGWPLPPQDETIDSTPRGTRELANQSPPFEPAYGGGKVQQSNSLQRDSGRTSIQLQNGMGSQKDQSFPLLDINIGSIDDLKALPGIGRTLAQRIIDRRSKFGRFRSVEELREIQGIGEKRLAQVRPFITTSTVDSRNTEGG